MDDNTYKKILKLIVIANILYFGFNNLNFIKKIISATFGLMFPFILGICMAFVMNMPMRFIEKHLKKIIKKNSISRNLSIFITIILFILVINLIIYMIIPEIVSSFNEIRIKLPYTIERLQKFIQEQKSNNASILHNFSKYGLDINKMLDSFYKSSKDMTMFDTSKTLKSIFSITSTIFSTLFNVFLGLIFSIYILSEKELFLQQSKSLINALFNKKIASEIISFFKIVENSFSKFIAGQGLESTILAMMFLVSMIIFKVPKAIPVSAILGVLSLIPYFGLMIGFIYAVLSIIIVSTSKAILFVVLFILIQQIEGNLIYPKVVGKSVGLPSIWVMFAITIIGGLLGFAGMIIAVPTMSVIYTLVSRFIKQRNS